MTKPDKPTGKTIDEELDALTEFQPDAGKPDAGTPAAPPPRLNVQADPAAPPEGEFPPLMGDQTLDRQLAARWKALRDAEREKERPDPWPIVERSFPRIAATIREHWGKRALDDYFSKLVIDERGDRQGFPPEVLEAIMEVARLHAAQFGLAAPVRPWESDVSETKWWRKR